MDNLPQTMDVYFPESGGPWPALVYAHGGSWMHGNKSEAVMFASRMTAQGYLVVSINYRFVSRGKISHHDVKCAIRSLRAYAGQYNLDPERIAPIGPIFWKHIYPNELIAMQ